MRSCTHHGLQPLDEYYVSRVRDAYGKRRAQYRCKACKKDYDALKPKTKCEMRNEKAAKRRQRLRLEVIQAYSSELKCTECGEKHIEFLIVDKVHESVKFYGNLYKWIKKNKFPTGFRILCYNCQHKIGIKQKPTRNPKPISECKDSYLRVRREWEKCPEKAEYHKNKKNSVQRENKLRVFTHYGAKCECCGNMDIHVLSLKRKHGSKPRGSGLYAWIIRNKFPKFFQILCLNCNKSRESYGKCPHEREI